MSAVWIQRIVALLLGLILGLSVPVLADHISEPTEPILDTRLELYQYRNRDDTLLTACDGSEVVAFDNLRIESSVLIGEAARRAGNPSEHFDERLRVSVVSDLGTRNEAEHYEWEAFWRHSNVPPHAQGGVYWESSQNSQQLAGYPVGTVLRVLSRITGQVSGVTFDKTCTFTVG